MLPRVAFCQGTNLRAWITLIVLIQCALILLYWDATRGGSSTSKSFALQDKASRDHLRAQGVSPEQPDVELRHVRREQDEEETQGSPSKVVGGDPSENFKRTGGADRGKSTSNVDHAGQAKQEVTPGRLISPETELLLYKHTKTLKYSGLSNGGDVLIPPEMQGRQGDLQFARNERADNMSKMSRAEQALQERQTNLEKYEFVESEETSSNLTEELQTPPNDNQIYTIKSPPLNTSVNISKDSSFSNSNTNILQVEVVAPNSTLVPTDRMPNINGLNKLYENYKKFEMTRMKLNQGFSNNSQSISMKVWTGSDNITENLENGTDATVDVNTKNMYSSSSVHLFGNNLVKEQLTPKPTARMKHAATRKTPRLRPGPTFNTPLPKDPYDLNTKKPIYNIGTIDEFHHATPGLPDILHLPLGENIEDKYFVKNGVESCFREGTAIQDEGEQTEKSHHSGCLCKRGWHGHQCSIPEGVFSSSGARFVELLKPRNTARRIISALAFNVEFELLEARLHELDDVIDAFIILESNYTNYGDTKPLHLLEKLREGYLKEFHHKIVYLFRGKIPKGGRDDGWLVDQHMRMFIGQAGMSRVANTAPDDIFIYTDADEIPNRQSILFLRMHDGYSEPFGVSLRWSVFGFFWKQIEPTRVLIGCTVGMFRYVFNNDAYQLRSTDYQNQASDRLHAYIASGAHIYDWHMGDNGILSGWHCSWCLPPGRIRVKLTSAINADFPRWGDFPEKLEIPYLRNLIKTGTWFDDKTKFGMLVSWRNEEEFAPQYILNNTGRFSYLLDIENT